MQHFIGVTALFVLYNIYYLLTAINAVEQSMSNWFIPINTAGIAVFLIAINWRTFRKGDSTKTKIWGVLLSVTIAFSAISLASRIPSSLDALNTFIFNFVPVLLIFTITSLLIIVFSSKSAISLTWTFLTIPILILSCSFLVYLEQSELWILISTNAAFLVFAGLKYFYLYLEKQVIRLPEIPTIDPLDQFKLTKTQKEITRLIIKGYSYEEIAKMRFIGHSTVTSHASKIFEKTNVHSREELEKKLRNIPS